MESKVRTLIAELNSLKLGELDRLLEKLTATHAELVVLGQPELAARVDDARRHLSGGDIPAFRKSIANVTAKLGHVRA